MGSTLRVCLITVGDPRRLTGGYLYHRRVAEAAPSHEADFRFVSVADRPFPLGVLDGGAALRRARALAPDVLVLDSIASAFVAPWLALHGPSAPLVGMLHQPPGGIDHGPMRTTVQRWLDRLSYRSASRLLVASEALAEELAVAGFDRDHLLVVAPGRDAGAEVSAVPPRVGRPGTDAGVASRTSELRAGRNAGFLCVANWLPRKGILDLLAAFAPLPIHSATLHLVGDPRAHARHAARIRARLAAADLADRVVVHGPLPRGAVVELYRAADAFILPSYRDPYGTVYAEAMAEGLPVVGWRTGNLPYLAPGPHEAVIVEPGDVDGLRRAMARLAEDIEFRRSIGIAARRRAQTFPTWEATASRFFAALREAIATADKGSGGGA